MPVDLRNQAGLQLGLLLIVTLVVLAGLGLAVGFLRASHTPTLHQRDRAGVALLVGLALIPIGAVVALSVGEKGLSGSISARWDQLTDPSASALPRNDNSRLTAAGSVRARYWDEALRIFEDNAGVGVGAGGYAVVRKRYRTADGAVRHAHGYVVQTAADLGLAGLAVSLALLAAWLAGAARATGLRRRDRGRPFPPERIGLLTLVAVVIVFGVHSFVDWTWFVPANAAVALLAAGWVAGRGPLARADAEEDDDARSRPPRAEDDLRERLRAGMRERGRATCAAAALLIVLATAWAVFQPMRADTMTQDALDKLDRGDGAAALAQAQQAHDVDPLSLDPLYAHRHDPDRGGPQCRGRRRVGGGGAPAARQPRPVATTRRVRVQYIAAAGGCAEGDPPGVVPRPPIF